MFVMATVTVNIPDETDIFFRRVVSEEIGSGKGVLGRAISEAMMNWAEEKEQKEIAERQLSILKKGLNLGKITYKKRAELYEQRSISH